METTPPRSQLPLNILRNTLPFPPTLLCGVAAGNNTPPLSLRRAALPRPLHLPIIRHTRQYRS